MMDPADDRRSPLRGGERHVAAGLVRDAVVGLLAPEPPPARNLDFDHFTEALGINGPESPGAAAPRPSQALASRWATSSLA